ncbi:MAG: diguanylate cyclase, partial [Clostridiales bacterium]|nr:diguanylate cyclase [Clostridiales bacterium]
MKKIIFLLFLTLGFYIQISSEVFHNSDKPSVISGKTPGRSLQLTEVQRITDNEDDFVFTYTVSISKLDIDKIDEDSLSLFTPMLQSEAFKILIDGKVLAIEGDVKNYNSNIWAKTYFYTIDKSYFKNDKTDITIIQYSRYMSGGCGPSFVIDGYQSSISLRNIYTIDIHQGLMGISLGFMLILLLLVVLLPVRRKTYWLMFALTFFMTISFAEFFAINYIPFDYLIFKKIIITSILLVVGIGTILFRTLLGYDKHKIKIIVIQLMIVIIPTLLAGNMIAYKKVYTMLSFLVVILLCYWCYLVIRKYKKIYYAEIILGVAVTSILFIILCDIFNFISPFLPSSTIVIMTLIVFLLLTLVITDIYELKEDVVASTKKYKKAYKKSIEDALTGVYNSKYMIDMIITADEPFAFVMIDIDDFKETNDKYGHLAGDRALIMLADEMTVILRESDYLGRFGGDEFMVFLRMNNTDYVRKILDRVRLKIEDTTLYFNEQYINITVSMGYYITDGKESFEIVVHNADKALYQAKSNGKNNVVDFNDYKEY